MEASAPGSRFPAAYSPAASGGSQRPSCTSRASQSVSQTGISETIRAKLSRR